VLDQERRELTLRGHNVAIGPQVFDILLMLISNRDHGLQQGRIAAGCVERPDRFGVDHHQPYQCRAQGDW